MSEDGPSYRIVLRRLDGTERAFRYSTWPIPRVYVEAAFDELVADSDALKRIDIHEVWHGRAPKVRRREYRREPRRPDSDPLVVVYVEMSDGEVTPCP